MLHFVEEPYTKWAVLQFTLGKNVRNFEASKHFSHHLACRDGMG